MVTPMKNTKPTTASTAPIQTVGQGAMKFTIPSIATLHSSTFAQGFSNNQHQAAARALLRHDVHIDGTHYQARQSGGLHPSYFSFGGTTKRTGKRYLTHEELLEASLQDVFDALTMQDCLNGRISVLIQCAGSEAITSPENLPIDLYITPRELQETPERIGGDLAVWVQIFVQEFTMPHLERFNQHCVIENVQPPQHFAASHICVKGPLYLPGPVVATGVHIKCSPQPAYTFTNELQATATHDAPSAAIHGGAEMGASVGKKILNLPHSQVRQCRYPDIFTPTKVISEGLVFSVPKLEQDTAFFAHGPPLISIGPNTDAALDWIKLGDKNLPKLRVLVQTSFYATKHARHTQAQPCHCPKVTLSKDACAALKFQRTQKSCKFKDALDAAWSQIDDVTMTVATTHQKSFHRVQHDLHMGQGLLHSKHSKLSVWNTFCWKKSQEAKTENSSYGRGKDALQSLEFADQKETKKISGVRISMRSKINDITQTLKAVENELNSLNSRTGAEIMLYMTRGTTDLPLRAITFTIPGVNHFMDSVMGIDTQDFISKMEGFAIQGIKGEVTSKSKAKMQWADYCRNVVNPYQVTIKGWPEHIPFTNLSKASNTLPDLKHLLDCWQTGSTAWKVLDDKELAQLRREHNEKINSSQIIESHCRTQSNKGKKRVQPVATDNVDPVSQKKYKSAETVESSDDEETQTRELLTTSDSTIVSPSSSTPVLHVNTSNLAIMSSSSSTTVPNSQSGTNFFNDQSSTGLSGADLSNTMDMFPFDYDAALACLDELFNGHALRGTDFIIPLP
ncbi:hypothetical protein EDB19DRAFT_1834028 [Suillus lakei]|nr:hypothetical protein EDB19DRAFT_1834028 [Suillus lakei]